MVKIRIKKQSLAVVTGEAYMAIFLRNYVRFKGRIIILYARGSQQWGP